MSGDLKSVLRKFCPTGETSSELNGPMLLRMAEDIASGMDFLASQVVVILFSALLKFRRILFIVTWPHVTASLMIILL